MSRLNNITSHLKLPLIAAPMFLISGPELVITACKLDIVGSFLTPNARNQEIISEWLTATKQTLEDTEATWAVNLRIHCSYPRHLDELALLAKAKPPIVITALGSPV